MHLKGCKYISSESQSVLCKKDRMKLLCRERVKRYREIVHRIAASQVAAELARLLSIVQSPDTFSLSFTSFVLQQFCECRRIIDSTLFCRIGLGIAINYKYMP